MNLETCPICGNAESEMGYHLWRHHERLIRETFGDPNQFDPSDREPEQLKEMQRMAAEWIEIIDYERTRSSEGRPVATTEEILEYGGEHFRTDFIEYDLERLEEQGRIKRTEDGWEVIDS